MKFSRDAESCLRSLTTDSAFVPVKSEHSIRDLEKKAAHVASVLKNNGIQCAATVDPKESTVVLWLDKSQVKLAQIKLNEEGVELSAVKIVPYGEVELTKGS